MPDTPVTPSPLDAYPPAQMAHLVEDVGVRKANLPTVPTLMLGLLAGAFISFGALFYTIVIRDSMLDYGPTRRMAGMMANLIPVTLGNIVGGGLLVGGV